jgi:hypothetical protein
MEAHVEKFEVIRTAHLIDHHLEQLAATLASEVLRKKVLAIHTEWRELAFAMTAHVCGVEASSLPDASKKNFRNKGRRLSTSTESEARGPEDAEGYSTLTPPTTLSTIPEERR